jgi:hypothetical protein
MEVLSIFLFDVRDIANYYTVLSAISPLMIIQGMKHRITAANIPAGLRKLCRSNPKNMMDLVLNLEKHTHFNRCYLYPAGKILLNYCFPSTVKLL